MSDDRSTVDRVVELAVHVPVGIAAFARDAFPTLVTMFAGRGKREVDVHQREVVGQIANYRAVGELAVKFGPPVVKQRLNEQIGTLRTKSVEAFESFSASSKSLSGITDRFTSNGAEGETSNSTSNSEGGFQDAGNVSTETKSAEPIPSQSPSEDLSEPASGPVSEAYLLSIPDYDALAASQIIERLEGLNSIELNDVENYERSTRARRTILGKIAILRRA